MDRIPVGLATLDVYDSKRICQRVDELCTAIGFKPRFGDHVVLKPNLVASAVINDLACTHPEFVGGVARWFMDHGCQVRVGDSPASGSCLHAMEIVGMDQVVQNLGLQVAPFIQTVRVTLDCGVTVSLCRDALDCDLLINLPKVKSHALVRVTLAVKNYFGLLKGWRKAMAHQVYGGGAGLSFLDILCDLPKVVPAGVSLCDGITAMHITGPMGGKPYPLNLMGCSVSPLGLDVSLLEILGVDPRSSPLWCQFSGRRTLGHRLTDLSFPLLSPSDVAVSDFIVPSHLNSLRFNWAHVVRSVYKRLGISFRTDS